VQRFALRRINSSRRRRQGLQSVIELRTLPSNSRMRALFFRPPWQGPSRTTSVRFSRPHGALL